MMIPKAVECCLHLRAYAEPIGSPPAAPRHRRRPVGSPFALFIDTETTADFGHALRLVVYQLRDNGKLIEQGVAYTQLLSASEQALLKRYADTRLPHGKPLRFLTHEEFINDVLFGKAIPLRATIVGANLEFDLARLAIGHGSARGNMLGAFSFRMSRDKRHPHIQVKHLSRKSALMRLTAPFRRRDSRSGRKRGKGPRVDRGSFLDILTLANAIYSRPFSLALLSKFLKVHTLKEASDEHGQELTDEYIEYALRDVQCTWECYEELVRRYDELQLTETPPQLIYSEASIGKACLDGMRLKPWRELQTCPASIVAVILSAYFGGRSEVRIRRQITRVILCDFLSMYPTVCTLMRLWRFVVAEGMSWHDATEEVRILLNEVQLSDLQRPEAWRNLTTLVRVRPDKDIFPIRADYDGLGQPTIGANYLSADGALWFTLADCIAAKLLTGKAPEVEEAITFRPGPLQKGMCAIVLPGGGTLDPAKEDFYKSLIERREAVKARRDAAMGELRDALDAEQNALKIAANATSYGIFVEVNVQERPNKTRVGVNSPVGPTFELGVHNVEQPGRFFHPLLATLITGAARLMLAIAERLVADIGLTWAFCDTDSMAIAMPEEVSGDEFLARVGQIVQWLSALNPYEFKGSILKVEKQNFSLDDEKTHEPLYCLAISSKRYALFNIDAEGLPVLRKASAHGLGHLRAPYDEKRPAKDIPAPALAPAKIGVELWQHDIWWTIVKAALDGSPDKVNLDYHEALTGPAVSRYAATTPKLLRWFATYNKTRSYEEQVKPFGFLLAFLGKEDFVTEVVLDGTEPSRRWTKPKPIAPYHKNLEQALAKVRDRDDESRTIQREELKTYAEALGNYHLSAEAKFLNGEALDRGVTKRRHVYARMDDIQLIGKEANRWEEQFFLGLDDDAIPMYPRDNAATSILRDLKRLADELGTRELAVRLGLSRGTLSRLLRGEAVRRSKRQLAALRRAVSELFAENEEASADQTRARDALGRLINELGLSAASAQLQGDPSNLSKILRGQRPFPSALAFKLLG
jgi:hypothetical protein